MALGAITLVAIVPAFAFADTVPDATTQTNSGAGGWAHGDGNHGDGMMRPVVVGTVSSISGNTIVVTRKNFGRGATSTSTDSTQVSVDATNAKIMKSGTTGTIASIVVGDTVVVQGTMSGTSVVATTINDGVMRGGPGKMDKAKTGNKSNSKLPDITGNGQPVVAGTISTITGTTLNITNKSNVSYTVDATNAKITKGPDTATISNLAVGDNVIVQGTVNGNAVVASSVIDQTRPSNGATSSATTTGTTTPPESHGFFGGIGSFFAHLFGF